MTNPRAKVFFALYLCAIVYLSLFPGAFQLHPKMSRLLWTPLSGKRQVLDFILNVLFYAPLGASGCLAVRRRGYGALAAAVLGFALSLTIEWLQLWTPSRFGNLTDLTSNTLGAVSGAALAYVADRWSWLPRAHQDSLWTMTPSAWLLLSAWLLWQMFPFVPAVLLARLTELSSLIAPWSWRVAIETLLGFAVLATVIERRVWLWIAFAALPAQAFLLDRALSPSAVCGALAGWVTVRLTGGRWLAPILGAWLVFEEFRPFSLADQPEAFHWAPFESWYDSGPTGYYPSIFGKLFIYLALVWSLRRRGQPYRIAIGIPAMILAAGEWTQRYLEGRTPETTDLVLLAAAGVLLKLSEFGVKDE